jgi:hypothetical protein
MTRESGYAGCESGVRKRTSRSERAERTSFWVEGVEGTWRRVGRSDAANMSWRVGMEREKRRRGCVPKETIFLSVGGEVVSGREYVVRVPSRDPMSRVCWPGTRDVITILRAGAESCDSRVEIRLPMREIN